MQLNKWQRGLLIVLVVGIALAFGSAPASATHDPFIAVDLNEYVGDVCHDFSKCGYDGPLLWMPYTAVASGLVWKTGKAWDDVPELLIMRVHSEMGQNDVYDPSCINELVGGNGRVNDGIVDPIYGGPYKAPFSAWPVPESEWLAMFSPPHSEDVMTPCSTPGSQCDPAATAAGKSYPNVLFSNEGTTAAVPYPDNYGVFANGTPVTGQTVNSQGGALTRCLRSSFKQGMVGGYNQRQTQTLNMANRLRIVYDRNLEGSLVWDFSHPDAFKNAHGDARVTAANAFAPCPQAVNCSDPLQSKRDSEVLSEPDAHANINAFFSAGYSKRLYYNLNSAGFATLADGKVAAFGGENLNSDNGYRKVNLYDHEHIPTNQKWRLRPQPCQLKLWKSSVVPPYGPLGYQAIADAVALAGPGGGESLVNPPSDALNGPGTDAPDWPTADCDQHDSGASGNPNSNDPHDFSDMASQRSNLSATTLPNGTVAIFGGTDLDESGPTNLPDTTKANYNNRDNTFRGTLTDIVTTEEYDPRTDRTGLVSDAIMTFPLFPQSAIRETGTANSNWQLCAVANAVGDLVSTLYCLDNIIDNNNNELLVGPWTPMATTTYGYSWIPSDTTTDRYANCCAMVDMTEINLSGKTSSHRLYLVGGVSSPPVGHVEVIDITPNLPPAVATYTTLLQPTLGVHALALPDGNILVSGGTYPTAPYMAAVNLRNQIICVKVTAYCPALNTSQVVGQMTVPRNLHAAYHLMHTGEVLQTAGDRTRITQSGARMYPPGDGDLAVNSAQIFTPPYLYDVAIPCPTSVGCQLATRPVIKKGPNEITYGSTFQLTFDSPATASSMLSGGMVSMIRTGVATNTLAQEQVYVKLLFKPGKDANSIGVTAPTLPAQAKPGDYMLFAVNNGVPSMAKHVRLETPPFPGGYVHYWKSSKSKGKGKW